MCVSSLHSSISEFKYTKCHVANGKKVNYLSLRTMFSFLDYWRGSQKFWKLIWMNNEFKIESGIYYEITEFIDNTEKLYILLFNSWNRTQKSYLMFHISYSRIIKFKSHMQSKVLKKKRSKKGRVTRNHFYLEAT